MVALQPIEEMQETNLISTCYSTSVMSAALSFNGCRPDILRHQPFGRSCSYRWCLLLLSLYI